MAVEERVIRGQQVVDDVDRIIGSTITRESLYDLFRRLQFPSPSGTELYSAGPAVRAVLDELQVPLRTFTTDFLGLEFPALFTAGQAPDLMFAAHADEISYIVPRSTRHLDLEPGDLIPNFAHRPHPKDGAAAQQYAAAVVRWCGPESGYRVVGSGTIHWTAADIRPRCILDALEGTPQSGDRVVYAPPVEFEQATGLLTGKVDNRAGVAACIAMCQALSRIASHLDVDPAAFRVGMLFPGQEEGTIGPNGEIELAFSRDARAAGLAMAVAGILPRAWINVDGHDLDPPSASGLYSSVVSESKGMVVPPHLLAQYQSFFESLRQNWGIDMRQTTELGGKVSRSDESGLLGVIPKRVIPVGYSCRNPHYNQGLPTTHIDSLRQLASALTWLAIAFRGVPRTGTYLQVDRH